MEIIYMGPEYEFIEPCRILHPHAVEFDCRNIVDLRATELHNKITFNEEFFEWTEANMKYLWTFFALPRVQSYGHGDPYPYLIKAYFESNEDAILFKLRWA